MIPRAPAVPLNGTSPKMDINGCSVVHNRAMIPRAPAVPSNGTSPEMDDEKKVQASFKWTGILFGFIKSFALKAVCELSIPDILAKAGGQLTVDEIAEKLPSKNVQIESLGRIMTYAALHDLFTEISEPDEVDQGKKRFALTPISEMLVDEKENPTNLSHMTRLVLSNKCLEAWLNLSGAVLSGTERTEPFRLVHGKSIFEAAAGDPEFGRALHNGMACTSILLLRSMLKVYKGFKDVKQLVDVGGGFGRSLMSIVEAYPNLKGINFDVPHVISQAPNIPRVTHMSGDMFKSVPEGDAAFLKWILHDWSDEKCVQILKICYKALPDDGKVIILDGVLSNPKSADEYAMDMVMLAQTTGTERTVPQWHRILNAAGFQRVEIFPVPTFFESVIEGYKS